VRPHFSKKRERKEKLIFLFSLKNTGRLMGTEIYFIFLFSYPAEFTHNCILENGFYNVGRQQVSSLQHPFFTTYKIPGCT
jgi:hypothetical protein